MNTAKVLINIATVHFLLKNVPEALKYYNHSIEVLNLISQTNAYAEHSTLLPLLAELGKVHMSLGSLYKQLGERPACSRNLETAVVKLEAFCDEMEEIDAQIQKKHRPKHMTYAFYI